MSRIIKPIYTIFDNPPSPTSLYKRLLGKSIEKSKALKHTNNAKTISLVSPTAEQPMDETMADESSIEMAETESRQMEFA